MNEVETDSVTVPAVTFDAMGHCTTCRLEEGDIKRVTRMLMAGMATVLRTYPGCDHPIMYCSVGNWTEIARMRGVR